MQHHRQGGPEATANIPGHQNQAPPSTAAPWPPALRRKPPGQRRTSQGHRLHSRTPAARIRTTRKHCAGLIKANSAMSTILATQEEGAHENPCLPIQIRPHGLMSKENRGQLRHQQSGAEASLGRADFLPPEEQYQMSLDTCLRSEERSPWGHPDPRFNNGYRCQIAPSVPSHQQWIQRLLVTE